MYYLEADLVDECFEVIDVKLEEPVSGDLTPRPEDDRIENNSLLRNAKLTQRQQSVHLDESVVLMANAKFACICQLGV